jgi:glycine/D-amino acid oxidase-like deaminating enzyme/nitrite reductase/ring-hydroxylating ferredoxin subunit
MTETAWQDFDLSTFPKLTAGKSRYDIVVVGGGITGLSAAHFLKEAGKKVCVLERKKLASGDTFCTTAHLTHVTDERLSTLVNTFGRDQAKAVWQAGALAIDAIQAIATRFNIDCHLQRVPGFLHTPIDSESDERGAFKKEAELARDFGFDAEFVESAPIVHKPGIRFANQAKFHPLMYLAGLAKAIDGDGSHIFENSEVTEVQDDPLVVKCGEHEIECDYVVIATHVPLMGKTGTLSAALFQTKIAPYTSYVLGAKIPRDKFDEISLWDTNDPYNYLRIDRGPKTDYAIFGGADHKTGQSDPQEAFHKLGESLMKTLPDAVVDRRWSGQVIETNDGLPFIGEIVAKQFVATGFAGNGMTFGTFAGMMARDAVLGRKTPWQELFDPHRKKLHGGTWDYLKENFDYPYYYLRDRLVPADGDNTREVARGEGKILKIDGQKVACARDKNGKLTQVSAYCTHMGCIVHWNGTEKSWDCPCHGSRFTPEGKVIAGPAETPLEPMKASTDQASSSKDESRKSSNGTSSNAKKAAKNGTAAPQKKKSSKAVKQHKP